MTDYLTTDGHTQIIVPLTITPFSHQALPTITGSLFSEEAGTVLYGHYSMEYLLPGGDRLRLIANHDKKTVQLLLFTHQAELITLLPGERPSSLVAQCISMIHRYRIRSESYQRPLTPDQEQKFQIANQCIHSLKELLHEERQLNSHEHERQEQLRKKVLVLIEQHRDKNRLLANNPLVSEGTLGNALYDAHIASQHYAFNRVYSVSEQDQMDFSNIRKNPDESPCFIWDSELHVGHNRKDLDDALRVICQHYQLIPTKSLNQVPANRGVKTAAFFQKLWHEGHDWVNYLANTIQPQHKTEIEQRADGVTLTKITPYYTLQGLTQKNYPDLSTLIAHLLPNAKKPIQVINHAEALKVLAPMVHGHWAHSANEQILLLKIENKLIPLRYFIHEDRIYPLPTGQDLYSLGQLSRQHLYLPERTSLKFKAFLSRIPRLFSHFYQSMRHFIIHDLHEDFVNHIHASHQPEIKPHEVQEPKETHSRHNSVILALEDHGFLANGQTLEEFIKEQIKNSPYVIAQAEHPQSPPAYDNPFHRLLNVVRHIAAFFIDTSERDPIIGTLSIAAYAYGGGAVLAPDALANLLNKLHLSGLIAGIEPTQRLAHLMNHGAFSEAVSASVFYWQCTVVGGNLDKFFVEAIALLKDDPAEIAIIAALALSLGYGLTKVIPPLEHEMGTFPYMNYAALGGKGGAALYDTIMHPGDDWFLGTCKWLCKGIVLLGKVFIAPCMEGYYYGFHQGFLSGWKKNSPLISKTSKQFIAASADFILALITIPLLELSALFIHVPFRGLTNLFTKSLASIGSLSSIGKVLLSFTQRPPVPNLLARFRVSPLYGFNSPLGHYATNRFINIGLNCLSVVFFPLMQLIKNLVILPLADFISLIARIGITLMNPLSRTLAYGIGQMLVSIGTVWDNSIGRLFTASAHGLTQLFNWIDNRAGDLKQNLLSRIENQRAHLFHWAFAEEDIKLHTSLTDETYYSSDPMRCERIPHQSSHCLLSALLGSGTPQVSPAPCIEPTSSNLFTPANTQATSQQYEINSTI
ncbi:MAG: hypothetical protein P4L65_08600 [Legionella sp.]|nr:hypothetical protein [Legionella sp.]